VTAHIKLAPSERKISFWRERIKDCLDQAIDSSRLPGPLKEAIRYGSTIPAASRWRAILVLQVGESLGSHEDACLLAAAAVEALHCATLCVDDLPCMDDASERRGRPSMHQRFNEAVAIQAALWLLGISRTLVARAVKIAHGDDHPAEEAESLVYLSELQQRTENELQLGQFMDVMGSSGRLKVDAEEVARLKCASVFALAAQVAVWLSTDATVRQQRTRLLGDYGAAIGLAYQALDDLDDDPTDTVAESWSESGPLGRPTFVAQFGKEGSLRLVDGYRERATAALLPLEAQGRDCTPLGQLASLILRRTNVCLPAEAR
jgi:geranylgeranyl pyrophosphate synthase